MQDLSGYWEQFVFLLFLQSFPLHITGIAEVFTGERLSEHYSYFCRDRKSVLTFFLNKQQEGCFHLHFVASSRNNRQLKKTSIRPSSPPFKIPTLSLPAALHLPSLKETHKQNSQRFRKSSGGTIVGLVRQEISGNSWEWVHNVQVTQDPFSLQWENRQDFFPTRWTHALWKEKKKLQQEFQSLYSSFKKKSFFHEKSDILTFWQLA